jgi:hypothetical protein
MIASSVKRRMTMLTTCIACEHEVATDAETCPNCGHPLIEKVEPLGWSPGIAALLSFLLPGAGHVYRGNVGFGILWFLAVVAGYCAWVIPGLFLHFVCVGSAMTLPKERRMAMRGKTKKQTLVDKSTV